MGRAFHEGMLRASASLAKTTLVLLAISLPLRGAALELIVWTSYKNHPPFVLPKRANESREAAVRRYVQGLASHSELAKYTKGYRNFPVGQFSKLPQGGKDARSLLVINDTEDLKPGYLINTFYDPAKKARGKPYAVPLAADVGLTKPEKRELAKILDREFPHFIHMGGGDINPAIYKEKNTHSISVQPRRDEFEVMLLEKKIKTINSGGRADRITGVCRASQLTSALCGYKVGQDVPTFVKDNVGHGPNVPTSEGGQPSHEANLKQTRYPFIKDWLGQDRLKVNTYHHQYVQWKEGGPLELAAVADDGVPEALISKDGRIKLFQFHPELMVQSTSPELQAAGKKIMDEIMAPAPPKTYTRACGLVNGLRSLAAESSRK